MDSLMLENATPDFGEFERVIRGGIPERVHLVELLMDKEMMQDLVEGYLGRPWIPLVAGSEPAYYHQLVDLYYRLGYDCVNLVTDWLNQPDMAKVESAQRESLPRGQKERGWVDEHRGIIANWADYEAFPWDAVEPDYRAFELIAASLPEGMKMTPMATVFTHVHAGLLGTTDMLYLLYDNPDLVAAVFQRWGQLVYEFYANLVDMDEVGAIWHADDLGFTTSTMVSPQFLRQHVLPWFAQYAKLAHDHGKTFWLHCCGNVYVDGIIDDLIDDVGIDAFHSYQDPILSISEFQAQYGQRVAGMGGVDMDKLCRLDEKALRAYMRDILDHCMPQGRFAFGTGNTVTNYVPIEHYVWMIDEARRWR